MDRFALTPLGPYSLEASVRFLEGFVPAAYNGAEADHFHLAFVADGSAAVAGVCIRDEDGAVVVEVVGGVTVALSPASSPTTTAGWGRPHLA